MTKLSVWAGSEAEWYRLQTAVAHHCECQPNEPKCSAHKLLVDQKMLNHLAFACSMRAEIVAGEWRR